MLPFCPRPRGTKGERWARFLGQPLLVRICPDFVNCVAAQFRQFLSLEVSGEITSINSLNNQEIAIEARSAEWGAAPTISVSLMKILAHLY